MTDATLDTDSSDLLLKLHVFQPNYHIYFYRDTDT